MICNNCHQRTSSDRRCEYCGSTSLRNAGMGDYGSFSEETTLPVWIKLLFLGIACSILGAIFYFIPFIVQTSFKSWIIWATGSLIFSVLFAIFINYFTGSPGDTFEDVPDMIIGAFGFACWLTLLKLLVIAGHFGFNYLFTDLALWTKVKTWILSFKGLSILRWALVFFFFTYFFSISYSNSHERSYDFFEIFTEPFFGYNFDLQYKIFGGLFFLVFILSHFYLSHLTINSLKAWAIWGGISLGSCALIYVPYYFIDELEYEEDKKFYVYSLVTSFSTFILFKVLSVSFT